FAGGRVHNHALWLVNHDDLVVLIGDVEGDRLSLRPGGLRRGEGDCSGVAGVDAVAGIADRAAADGHLAREDERLESRARKFGDVARQRAGEPLAGVLLGDHDLPAAWRTEG